MGGRLDNLKFGSHPVEHTARAFKMPLRGVAGQCSAKRLNFEAWLRDVLEPKNAFLICQTFVGLANQLLPFTHFKARYVRQAGRGTSGDSVTQ